MESGYPTEKMPEGIRSFVAVCGRIRCTTAADRIKDNDNTSLRHGEINAPDAGAVHEKGRELPPAPKVDPV